MSLREKINEQFNNALKAKNRTLISTLRLILSAIKEHRIIFEKHMEHSVMLYDMDMDAGGL